MASVDKPSANLRSQVRVGMRFKFADEPHIPYMALEENFDIFRKDPESDANFFQVDLRTGQVHRSVDLPILTLDEDC